MGWPRASKLSGWHLSPLPHGLGLGQASSLPHLSAVRPMPMAATIPWPPPGSPDLGHGREAALGHPDALPIRNTEPRPPLQALRDQPLTLVGPTVFLCADRQGRCRDELS